MQKLILTLLFISFLNGCNRKDNLPITENIFAAGEVLGKLDTNEIKEASGLAESINNPDLLWTHNDGGDKARIFLIDKEAHHKATIWFANIKHRDWEDIAVGPGPETGKHYIYVGDIGDNESEYEDKYIYRIEEPII